MTRLAGLWCRWVVFLQAFPHIIDKLLVWDLPNYCVSNASVKVPTCAPSPTPQDPRSTTHPCGFKIQMRLLCLSALVMLISAQHAPIHAYQSKRVKKMNSIFLVRTPFSSLLDRFISNFLMMLQLGEAGVLVWPPPTSHKGFIRVVLKFLVAKFWMVSKTWSRHGMDYCRILLVIF